MLQERALIIKRIRSFFDKKNYLELDTPLLSGDLIPESCLEVFQTERLFPAGSKKKSAPLWLIPSPEIWMKKIIARHKTNVFQICKCFRNGESQGRLHNAEFTMLEYYTMNAGYLDSLSLTEELINFLLSKENAADKERREILFERITLEQCFKKFAGFDLFAASDADSMARQARRLGLEPSAQMNTAQIYDLIFIHAVEPQLKTGRFTAVIDYPAFVPCLAKQSKDGKTVERWELYFNGIELANCFSEETDPQKVKEFFNSEAEKKDHGAVVKHNIDHNYWKMFEPSGAFPLCSGAALGIDRLVMALTGRSAIDSVLPFAESE